MLSKRLKSIASFVDPHATVVDVGCDHALLDIALTKEGHHCIASDINENALQNAFQNIQKYQLEDQIELIQSNGLENISIPKHATVVIAGMGTSNILHILKETKEPIETLILSSHNEHTRLRIELNKMGYVLIEETIVEERGKFYYIVKCKQGKATYRKRDFYLGPILATKKESNAYYQYLKQQNQNILASIPWYYVRKRKMLKQQQKWLFQVLK